MREDDANANIGLRTLDEVEAVNSFISKYFRGKSESSPWKQVGRFANKPEIYTSKKLLTPPRMKSSFYYRTINTTGAVSGIAPSRFTKLYLDIGYPIKIRKIRPGKRNGNRTSERRRSLLDCLTATWETISRPYFQAGYHMNVQIRKAEKQIEKIQLKVLDGKASLCDFRKAVKRWEQAVKSAVNMNFQETINYM
jgi:hypothetical protein